MPLPFLPLAGLASHTNEMFQAAVGGGPGLQFSDDGGGEEGDKMAMESPDPPAVRDVQQSGVGNTKWTLPNGKTKFRDRANCTESGVEGRQIWRRRQACKTGEWDRASLFLGQGEEGRSERLLGSDLETANIRVYMYV
jgi:hypothetical protein